MYKPTGKNTMLNILMTHFQVYEEGNFNQKLLPTISQRLLLGYRLSLVKLLCP